MYRKHLTLPAYLPSLTQSPFWARLQYWYSAGSYLPPATSLSLRRRRNPKQDYRRQRLLSTVVLVIGAAIIVGLWSKLFQHTSTFLGLIAAGLAVALREPLLSIAGRIAIFVGHMYTAGDRIEINKMSGDVSCRSEEAPRGKQLHLEEVFQQLSAAG